MPGSIAEFGNAAQIRSDGILRGGDGAAHHYVIGAYRLGVGRGHDALLVAAFAFRKADAGGDGDEFLTAARR